MENWLKMIKSRSESSWVRWIATTTIALVSIWGVISILSDIGFSPEIIEYRGHIIISTIVLAISLQAFRSIGSFYLNSVALHKKIEVLEEEKKSLINTMIGYRSISKNTIIQELKYYLIFSEMKLKWMQRDARVERFRSVNSQDTENNGQQISLLGELSGIEALINIGKRERVTEGMNFIVQDPVDAREYGTLEVIGVFESASVCRINRPIDPAFWTGILNQFTSSPHGFSAPPNKIMLFSPLTELGVTELHHLSAWLESVDEIDTQAIRTDKEGSDV